MSHMFTTSMVEAKLYKDVPFSFNDTTGAFEWSGSAWGSQNIDPVPTEYAWLQGEEKSLMGGWNEGAGAKCNEDYPDRQDFVQSEVGPGFKRARGVSLMDITENKDQTQYTSRAGRMLVGQWTTPTEIEPTADASTQPPGAQESRQTTAAGTTERGAV